MIRNKIYFLLRSVYRNITYAKIRSLFLLATLTLLFSFLLMGASLKNVLNAYYIDKYRETYGEVDLVMSIGQQSTSRYFSFRQLEDNQLSDGAYPVFEVLMQHQTTYYKVVLSNQDSTNYITSQTTPSLDVESIIISKTFAKDNNYLLGDIISLKFGETTYPFKIAYIAEVSGQFDKDTFIINHTDNIKRVISNLVPSLSGFNQTFFSKLYNKVYFETDREAALTTTIKAIPTYESFEFTVSMPYAYINQQVNRSVSLYLMIFLFICIALILLIQTLITFRFSAYQKDFAIYTLHGYRPLFSIAILAVEFMLLGALSAVISYFVAYTLINFGLNQLGSQVRYLPKVRDLFIVLVVFQLILLLTVFYHQLSLRKKSIITHIKQQVSKTHFKLYVWTLISSLSIFLWIEKSSGTWALFALILVPIILFSLLKVGLSLLYKIKTKNAVWMTIKGMFMGKKLVSYLAIGLICSLSVLLLIQTQSYMSRKKTWIDKEFKADIVLSGIFGNIGSVKHQVSIMPEVVAVTEFSHFESIAITEHNQIFHGIYDLDPLQIPTFFDLNIPSDTLLAFSQTLAPSIILPMRYHVLFGLEAGDVVNLSLSDDIGFIISGFFEHSVGNIAFVNLNKTTYKNDFQPKSLIIVSSDKTAAMSSLKDTFSEKFYMVIDFAARADALILEINKAMAYASFISLIIIVALFVALLNQGYMLYDSLTQTYSLLSIYGKSKSSLLAHMALELSFVNLFYIVLSFIGIIMVNPLLKPLLLLFGEYEPIVFKLSDLPLAITLILVMSFMQSLAYMLYGSQLNAVNAIKLNENA